MVMRGSCISYADIPEALGVLPGEVLYIGSDIRRLVFSCLRNREDFDVTAFIKAFMDRLGIEGVMLLPTFNWGFCRGEGFDYVHTPGMTGSMGNYALTIPGFKRTRHPIYSFAVYGRDRDLLCGLDNKDAFGPSSPFQYLFDADARHLSLGLDWPLTLTYIHHIEQISGKCRYRFHKDFSAPYTDESGATELRTYSMFVRKHNTVFELERFREMVSPGLRPERHHLNDTEFCFIRYREITDLSLGGSVDAANCFSEIEREQK